MNAEPLNRVREEIALSLVGIIANPASGKDIRRLVAYGSVFDNQEKVRILRRVLIGLSAVGVERICYMQDYFGIVDRALSQIDLKIPISALNFKLTGTQEDTVQAARKMAGVRKEVFRPRKVAGKVYDRLFAEYDTLHDYFGRSVNPVMKTLKALHFEQAGK